MTFFSHCTCRRGILDGHGMKSSDVVKAVVHESFNMLPLEAGTDACENDRNRTSQLYPGAVSRDLWKIMQSSTTKDGKLFTTSSISSLYN